jgi:MFS family permease
VTFFVLTFGLYSIEPIVTVYVAQLAKDTSHVALVAGLVFSASGLANIIAAPRLGKLSDKVGAHKVMLVALVVAGIIYIPQAFVGNPWQLMGLRFLLGLTIGGLNPSINALVKQITPDSLVGNIFGFTMSAGYLGVFGGAVLGGQVAAYLGIRYVFFVTSALLLINSVWVYFKVYKKLNVLQNLKSIKEI